jgi:4-amino-4-deoxy-L-arabinose transferase-like glycosyltransferase
MLTLLPFLTLIALILLLWGFFHQHQDQSPDLRLVILCGAVLWGVLLALLTEVLSLLGALHRSGLAIGWGALLLGTMLWLLLRWRRFRLKNIFAGFRLLTWFHLLGIAGIALITGAIAVIAAPNNWDSMVYHLSRAMHWLQNGSIAFYPTNILRQLYLPPWSEYLLAHLLGLSGSDRFAQLPQWFAMLGNVMGVSLMAKQLGARPAGQWLAAFATATLPMGILQATTTQNDAILAFWLVCLAVFILQGLQDFKFGWNLVIGTALGLALLTKSTGYIFALPFMLYYGIQGLRRMKLRFWQPVLAITLIIAGLNLPHYARNAATFGHPLGPQEEVSRYHNDPISLKGTLSNLLRNLGLYTGTIEPVNRVVYNAIETMHGWMGLDINDPRFTWSDHQFSVVPPQAHEDTTASSLHLLLLVGSFLFLIVKRKKLPSQKFILLGGLLACAFLIFCIYLRWQVWHPRLHLPLLVLGSAWIGLLERTAREWVLWIISLLLAVLVLPVLYFNDSKPLVADYNIFNLPRREVMIMRKNLVVPYIESVNTLLDEDCYQVGLYIPNEEWEYPFWSLYRDSGKPFRLEHVNVTNASAGLPMAPFSPCAIIATRSSGEQFILDDGSSYDLTWQMDPVFIYTKPAPTR